MVAISLYKGNLHKVPDVPRRWPAPAPTISLKDFKILLRRRARAMSHLRSSSAAINGSPISNPSPTPSSDHTVTDTETDTDTGPDSSSGDDDVDNEDGADHQVSEPELVANGDLKEGEEQKEDEVREEEKGTDERGDSLRKVMEKSDALVEEQKTEEKVKNDEVIVNPVGEKSNTENATTTDAEKRKKEVKEKLEILNEKKHGLVQVLKQILNAEEQLKRQNSTQGMSGRPPLQVDTTTDSGSMTKANNTPRLGSDGNPCGDMEGVEADDVSNHNMPSRSLPRMSSTSPSSDSQQRKPATSMVPHSYRTTMGIVGSPSRFAPAVSVSGTNYIASSPSPAASGGTSVFRDGRLPSPWN